MSKQSFEDSIVSISVEHGTVLRLLSNAKGIFSNVIGHCRDEACDNGHLCRQCAECEEMCKTIDEYIK